MLCWCRVARKFFRVATFLSKLSVRPVRDVYFHKLIYINRRLILLQKQGHKKVICSIGRGMLVIDDISYAELFFGKM
mgnify:CR=1 FL=1